MLTVSSWHSNLPIMTRYSIFTRRTIHSWWPLGTECSLASNSDIVWGCDTTKTMWKQQWIIILYSFDFLEDLSNNFKITTSTGFFPKDFHIISILFDPFTYLLSRQKQYECVYFSILETVTYFTCFCSWIFYDYNDVCKQTLLITMCGYTDSCCLWYKSLPRGLFW